VLAQFWSIYTLDIYASMVWGSIPHHRASYCRVSYPSEIKDTNLDPSLPDTAQEVSWLRGWNFTTDLYRVLERVMDVIAASRHLTTSAGPPPLAILDPNIGTNLASPSAPSLGSVMSYVNGLYDALPDTFKQVLPMTGNLEADIKSFQAANIIVTIYVSFSSRDFTITLG
jgi:hypothetical protein